MEGDEGGVWGEEMIEGMSGVEGTVSNGTSKTFILSPQLFPRSYFTIYVP